MYVRSLCLVYIPLCVTLHRIFYNDECCILFSYYRLILNSVGELCLHSGVQFLIWFLIIVHSADNPFSDIF